MWFNVVNLHGEIEMQAPFVVIAGQTAEQAREASKLANVKPGKYEGTFDSESLVAWQTSKDRWEAVEVVSSVNGWSVRDTSGLTNFALRASKRTGTVDGSLDDAKRWAAEWAAKDTTRRYAYMRVS